MAEDVAEEVVLGEEAFVDEDWGGRGAASELY